MSSKTKIVVVHMKELIYTGIFILLGIVLILLLVSMFTPENSTKAPKIKTKQEALLVCASCFVFLKFKYSDSVRRKRIGNRKRLTVAFSLHCFINSFPVFHNVVSAELFIVAVQD